MQSPALNFTPRGLYIDGRWVSPVDGGSFASINPSNMEKLADIPAAGEADVDLAVQAAKRGFKEWSSVPIKERARCLKLLADRIENNADELALFDAVDSGNAIVGMHGDMIWTADWLRYCAGLITEIKGETFSQGDRHLNLTRRQPFGVVAKINPFNHPFRFCAEKAAAPLAAGNTVVIKGSEQAPLSSLRLGELCDGIFPEGVVNIITGDGKVGSALVRHPDVRRIGFVGSVPTGRIIAQEAAAELKRVSLELGGKNPIVIFPDADPKEAAVAAIKGMNMNRQGQSCSSTSRVFVHASLLKASSRNWWHWPKRCRSACPGSNRTMSGRSSRNASSIASWASSKSAKAEGAQLLTGGGRPADPQLASGLFIAPTVFDKVTPAMRIGHQEIFGPVMSIMAWDDYEDMLAMVNGVEYGLTAAIVTNDLAKAMETAEQIEAGYVWINSSGRYIGAPYGGWKQSGIGEEECFDEILSYTQIKNINMRW